MTKRNKKDNNRHLRLEKNYRGIYVVCGRKPDGKRWNKSTGTRDLEEAQEFLRNLEVTQKVTQRAQTKAKARNELIRTAMKMTELGEDFSTSFESLFETWKGHERTIGMSPRTINSYRLSWNKFVRYAEGIEGLTDVESVTTLTMQEWLNFMRDIDGCSTGTRISRFREVSAVFSRTYKLIGLMENPCTGVVLPRNTDKKSRRPFTREEVEKIFNACQFDVHHRDKQVHGKDLKEPREYWLTLCMIGYYTGYRFGDCVTLELSSINFNNKTGKSTRFPIHPELQKQLDKVRWGRDEGYLFPREAELYKESDTFRTNSSQRFAHILKRAGIEKVTEKGYVDFHSFRHTFNTALYDAGVSYDVIKQMTGHTPEMSDHYRHMTDKTLQLCQSAVEIALDKDWKIG